MPDPRDSVTKPSEPPVVIKVKYNDLRKLLELYRGCDVSIQRTPAVGEWLVVVQ